MAGYGQQFYTRQEQEDAYASRLEPNPNRVGSGFVNYGPQVPAPQAAANWQTSSCLGQGTATPAQVSQIWNSTPAPPMQQPQLQQQPRVAQPQLQPQMQQLGVPQPFAAPTQEPKDVSAIFQSLGIDTTAAPQQQQPAAAAMTSGFPGVASVPLAFPTGLNPVSAMSAAAVQQPFVNGGLGGVPGVQPVPRVPVVPQQQPAPSQPASLMSLLQTPAGNPSALNASAFAPLGNGTVPQAACASRAQAAFSNPGPPAPQCQLPQNGVMSGSNAFAPNHAAFAPAAGAGRGQPVRPAPPKTLTTPSDYASAAVNYKAPPTRAAASTTSISRKPEISAKVSSQGAAQKEEWECPRCTFLNNSALWECEMCGFERAGKQQLPSEPAAEDGGWHTASRTPSKSVPANNNSVQSGKSKAQSKNEKRRAKKRGDP